ncbi:DUF420 domain-containing protein [Blastopirellula sp. JC732]|uniref:DUF420 domain-containing protein n=1 Tax=Blastopirellula sediminis TaxID=2894196 RepID=A0A9X1MRP1_9BACT|nr:DUF420 domain-containing protein [Blastopirellula sediminis]MCC9605311.1 DUF420 domain-containing protein [Blastopirellula sediminis]MCC9631389.1 DUF420 domain-containing protein [Blastopirellula sediminis]
MLTLIAQNYGFLPTRGSVMLDFVFLAMFAVIVIMGISIALVRFRRMYNLHKWLQITLGVVLLLAVVAFEVDMRFFTNWRELAEPSPYYASGTVDWSLYIHLAFAIPTPLLWIYVIVMAVRKFPAPVMPNSYSNSHKFWARIAAIGMTMTAVTGWIFYYLGFVAS